MDIEPLNLGVSEFNPHINDMILGIAATKYWFHMCGSNPFIELPFNTANLFNTTWWLIPLSE